MNSSVRVLARLIDRLEEFLEEYKTSLEVDDVSTVDDTISIIDRVKSELEEEQEEDEDDDDDDYSSCIPDGS